MQVAAAVAALTLVATGAARAAQVTPRVVFTSTIGGQTAGLERCPFPETDAWPLLGADPRHPARVRALYQAGGTTASVFAASSDGGRSWRRRVVADGTACTGGDAERESSVNPLFSVGARGVAYYGQSWIGHRDGMWAFGVLTHRLSDDSPSVGAPARAFHGQNAAVAADPENPDRVAMLWTQFNEVPNLTYTTVASSKTLFARSDDGGRTWSAPQVVDVPSSDHANVNTRLVRTSTGELVGLFDRLAYRDAPASLAVGASLPLTVHAIRSNDGGATWTEPVAIGRAVARAVADPDHGPGEPVTPAGSAKFDLAAGLDGEVVAVWHDGSRAVAGAIGRPDGTWTPLPRTLIAGGEYIQPAIAVDGMGTFGVFVYDFAEDTVDEREEWSITPRFAISDDRGRNWRMTPLSRPFDLHRTNRCAAVTGACELTVDFMAIGVYQDVLGLPRGFGVGYTVGPPLAADGFTEARYAHVGTLP